ncbi:MAG TPA: hypothetical protein VKA68_11385 [bacterium]|nr:hypothetical protein [bacterium]
MKDKSKTIRFRIESFDVKSFDYKSPEQSVRRNAKVIFNITPSLRIKSKDKLIKLGMGVKIMYRKKDPILLVELETETVFLVHNIDELKVDEEHIDIPEPFLTTLLSLTYSTIRGILIERLKETKLEKFVLPVIDPSTLLPSENIEKTE